jgi:trans-aconitate 2-methyltransferase
MEWNPELYLAFGDHRLRPALDLIARVPLDGVRRIVDLGCGSGSVEPHLAARWPSAEIAGVDNSRSMLEQARKDHPNYKWEFADIAEWHAGTPVDLAFSNAALHWLDGHERLFPRLLDQVASGGALAIQMPRNFSAPSHIAIRDTVDNGPWRERLAPLVRRQPVLSPEDYHRLLAPRTRSLDIWETEYLHVLEGQDPVVTWTRATALRPYLEALEERERSAFEAEYRARIRNAYPPEPDGRTLFSFKRLFIVAGK